MKLFKLYEQVEEEQKETQEPTLITLTPIDKRFLQLMADKDVEGFVSELRPFVDSWYVAELDDPRAMPSMNLAACLGTEDKITFPNGRAFVECYNQACADLFSYQQKEAESEGLIIVTGSFLCVSAVQESVDRNIKL